MQSVIYFAGHKLQISLSKQNWRKFLNAIKLAMGEVSKISKSKSSTYGMIPFGEIARRKHFLQQNTSAAFRKIGWLLSDDVASYICDEIIKSTEHMKSTRPHLIKENISWEDENADI